MSTATALIDTLTRQGVELRVDGDRLLFRPSERLSAELKAKLREHRWEILVVLKSQHTPTPSSSGQPQPADSGFAERVDAFRSQFRSWIGPGVPLLTLPGAPEPTAGHCVSCGVPIEKGWRCRPCLLAVYAALDVDLPEELLP